MTVSKLLPYLTGVYIHMCIRIKVSVSVFSQALVGTVIKRLHNPDLLLAKMIVTLRER